MTTPEISDLIYDWNSAPSDATRHIELLDDTMRDGLQSPSAQNPSIDQKQRFFELADTLGIDSVVLGLPGAGPQALDAVAGLAGFIARAGLTTAPVSAVRTHENDITAHLEAVQRSGTEISAGMFLGSSPIRLFAENWQMQDLITLTETSVSACTRNNSPVMFITEDTTRSRPQDLRDLYLAALNQGANRICLADTCGHADPAGVAALVTFVRDLIADNGFEAKIDWHGHNDRGLALANALTAIEAGADRIHATGLGLGERTGNTAMDQILVNLKLKGQAPTRDLAHLPEYCKMVEDICGAPRPYNYPVVGADAFRTATGVHAAAIVKLLDRGERDLADRVYSSVPARMIGLEQVIEVGPMSGRSNVRHWLSRNHPELKDACHNACIDAILIQAKNQRRVMTDTLLSEIVAAALSQQQQLADLSA